MCGDWVCTCVRCLCVRMRSGLVLVSVSGAIRYGADSQINVVVVVFVVVVVVFHSDCVGVICLPER